MKQYVEWVSAKDLELKVFQTFLISATDAIAPLKSDQTTIEKLDTNFDEIWQKLNKARETALMTNKKSQTEKGKLIQYPLQQIKMVGIIASLVIIISYRAYTSWQKLMTKTQSK